MKKIFKLLSYPISEKTPLYGGKGKVCIHSLKEIGKGNSCNTFMISFGNHTGTHIDAPRHFYSRGSPIDSYRIDDFIFLRPFVLNCQKDPDELIEPGDLKGIGKCDIVLIKTGYHKFRGLKKYVFNNPGFSSAAARYVRDRYPFIKAVGIDTVSITPYQNRAEGRAAHKVFLEQNRRKGAGVLLIEDMDLSGDLRFLKCIYAVPLFVRNIDSAPATVIGEF
jgi:kynurenine formamidase